MRRLFLCLGFLVAIQSFFAATLTLSDLETMCTKSSWEAVNIYLANKGWEYYDSENKYISYGVYNQTITWSYELDRWDKKALGWLYLYTDGSADGKPSAIDLQDSQQYTYTNLINAVKIKGYKQINSKIKNGQTEVTYENASFILTITTSKYEDMNDYGSSQIKTIRHYYICKKGSYFDSENGQKMTYHSNGRVETKYTLLNGKKHGIYYEYYEDGTLKQEIPYSNGIANGKIKGYYKNGKVRIEATVKNGKRIGSAIYYIYNDDDELIEKWVGEYTVEVIDFLWVQIRVGNNEYCDYISYEYTDGILTSETHCKLKGINNRGHITQYNSKKQVLFDADYLGDSIDGKAIYKTYNDEYNLIEEHNLTFVNGAKEGEAINKNYENGKLILTEYCNYHNGKYDGQCTYIHNQGDTIQMKILVHYKEGELDGKEEWIITEHDSIYLYQYKTYSKGKQIGNFREVHGDSLIIGKYDNYGELNGYYAIYSDWRHSLIGGFLNTDTTKLDKICIGQYKGGEKVGYWKYYDAGLMYKGNILRAEGTYINDKKHGLWKYYYPHPMPVSFFDDYNEDGTKNNETLCIYDTSHGGELYLTETYQSGKLNGLSTRYSTIASTWNDATYNKCTIKSYYKDNELNGEYLHLDSLGNTIIKGYYKNGKRDGDWYYAKTISTNGLAVSKVNYTEGLWKQTSATKEDNDYLFQLISSNIVKVTISNNHTTISEQSYYIPSDIKANLDSAFITIPDIWSAQIYLSGISKVYDEQGKLIKEMHYSHNKINGSVTEYLNSQNVKRIYDINNGYEAFERITDNSPFSGRVEYIDESGKQIINVKKGKRNGKTKIIDIHSNKTVQTINYKDGKVK